MWYIFEKSIFQGYEKFYSQVSNAQIQNTQIRKYSIRKIMFLLQTSVVSKFLVSTVVQFVRAYQQKAGHNGVLAFGKKKGFMKSGL